MGVLPLEVLQATLGETPDSLNWRPSPQQGWELDGLWGPLQHSRFRITGFPCGQVRWAFSVGNMAKSQQRRKLLENTQFSKQVLFCTRSYRLVISKKSSILTHQYWLICFRFTSLIDIEQCLSSAHAAAGWSWSKQRSAGSCLHSQGTGTAVPSCSATHTHMSQQGTSIPGSKKAPLLQGWGIFPKESQELCSHSAGSDGWEGDEPVSVLKFWILWKTFCLLSSLRKTCWCVYSFMPVCICFCLA